MRKTCLASILLGSLVALGCGDKKGGDDTKKDAPGQDWSGVALKPVEQTVEGVKVTIDLPEKMTLQDDEPTRKVWRADMKDYFSEPSVWLSTLSSAPKTLEEATKHYMVGKDNEIVRKEEVNGGFLITHHTAKKGLLYATYFKAMGGKHFVCKSSQAKDGGVPNFEKTKEWLEKICLSMKTK